MTVPVILAVLVAADWAVWRAGTAALGRGVDRWAAQAGAQGWTVRLGDRRRGGWPLGASLDLAGLRLEGGARQLPGGLAWQADRLTLAVSLLHPSALVVAIEGGQQVRLSHAPPVAFTSTTFTVRVALGSSDGGEAVLQADGIVGGLAGSAHPQDVQLAGLRLWLRSGERATAGQDGGEQARQAAGARLRLEATGLGLPDIGHWPLGATVAAFGGTLVLRSPTLPDAGHGQDAAAEATAWRDGGGRLDAQDVHLRWGPLLLAASARLELDDRLQPAGSGQADLTGGAAALDALAGSGVIARGLAATGQAILTLMPGAGRSGVHLPFVLRDSTVFVGQIPLVQIRDVAWRR